MCKIVHCYQNTFYTYQITANGAAHKTGKLRMGDRIMSANGINLANATHQEAVMALLNAPNEFKLVVRHDPPPKGLIVSASISSLELYQNSFLHINI